MIGVGVISLFVYIFIILILNVSLKRKVAEAMSVAYLILVCIGYFFGAKNGITLFQSSFSYAAKQEVVYASMAFVFMAFVMDKTGVIRRLVNILNSFLGRLPGGSGYVSTIGSVLFGMVSGSGSGNTAAIGSITIPWMMETGWSVERATMIAAGNSGMGMIFPPSSSMLLLLGMGTIASEVTFGDLYVGLLGAGLIVMSYRLLLVYIYARKDRLKAIPNDQILPFGKALKENGSSLIIFLGILIPLICTMGSSGAALKVALNATAKNSFNSISIILWIPILMAIFTAIEGWKYLPHSIKGWVKLIKASVGKYTEVGMLLFAAFAASNVLTQLGMSNELKAIFAHMGTYSSFLVILLIAGLTSMMVGPFTGTATTTAIGAAAYAAMRSIGIPPVVCCVAFLNLISNEGCIPPNAAPIYIATGISGLDNPVKIFKPLFLHFSLPVIIIAILIMMRIIPVIGG